MTQTLKLKRSAVSGRAPTTSDLELGELAINTTDGKIYIKKSVSGTESIISFVDSSTTAPVVDTMTGDGSDTTLSLSVSPASENQTFLTIDGVLQHKDTYSISGSTLTFDEAPANTAKVECITFVNTTITDFKDGDGDTKIQVEESSDDDTIRFDTAGSERMTINSSGVIQFNGAYTFPTSDGSADQVLKTDGSGALSFGTISSGSSTSISDADNDTKIQVEESSDEDTIRFDTAGVERMTISNTGVVNIKAPHADTNGGGQIILQPTDATDADDENYGSIEFQNSSNTTLAKISGVSEGSGDNKGHLRFSTKSGSGSLTQQMLIRDNDLIQIAAAVSMSSTLSVASGLTLSGDSSSQDALDDYEEGEFTPTGNNVTYTAAGGHYTKVGNRVWVTFYLQFPTTSDGSAVQITNLPFTFKNHDSGQARANANRGAFSVSYTNSGQTFSFLGSSGTTTITAHNFSGSAITNSQISAKAIYGGGFYEAA
jgi:hypothetical protein